MDTGINIFFVMVIILLYSTIPTIKYNYQIDIVNGDTTLVFIVNGVTEYYARVKIDKVIMALTLAGVKINNNNLKTIFRFDTEVTFVKIS